jgi:hypothetical protein
MARVTTAQCDAVLLAALRALHVDNGGPFEFVGRYRGQVTRQEGVDTETLGAPTAALLAWASDDPVERGPGAGPQTLVRRVTEYAVRSTWLVYVASQRLEDTDVDVAGSTNGLTPGMHTLKDAVEAALHGLVVPAPAATVTVRVNGTPESIVDLTDVTFTAGSGADTVSYLPAATSVTLDGDGVATVSAACITIGVLGNVANGTVLGFAPATPDGATAARAIATTTAGSNGLLSGEVVRFAGGRPYIFDAGVANVYALRFTALRPLAARTQPRGTLVPFDHLDGDLNLPGVPAEDPVTTPLRADPDPVP